MNSLLYTVQLRDPDRRIPALSIPAPLILSPVIVTLSASMKNTSEALSLAVIRASLGFPDSVLIMRLSFVITIFSV